MGFLESLTRGSAPATEGERRNWSVLEAISLGNRTASGVSVSEEKALRYSAVYACVRVLAETVASLPLIVYERQARGKERATDHYLYRLLHDAPNPLMTAFELRETLMGHLALWGNAYAEIETDGSGRVVALWPLRPDMMSRVQRVGNRLVYTYTRPDGGQQILPGDAVWHLRGLSGDGLVGYSPIQLMRQAVGLGMATEEFGARFFGNDARPGGVLQHPGVLGNEAFERLQASWESRHGGLSNSHRVAILEEGMQYLQIGIPPEDAQFLETRKFQVTEIARAFRVPPHMLADLERATFSNIEHQSIEFVVHSIRPWLVRWEQSIQQQLMLERERPKFFAEFVVDGLLRGDTISRYQAYATGRQNGWLSANDIRSLENMNPVEGGDIYLVPLNMVPADMAGEMNSLDAPAGDGGRGATGVEGRVLSPDGIEQRARATAAARQRLRSEFMPLFEEVMGRVVRREAADVKRFAQKYIANRDDLARFMEWVQEFYENEHRDFVRKNMHPVYVAYAAAVFRAAAAEVGSDEELEPGEFVDAYAESYAARYTGKQRGLLLDLIERTQADEGDVLSAVETRMDEWDEQRPAQEARDEAQRSNNALALLAYGALGVTVKRWVTLGKSCPYCKQLNGKTIGLTESFLQKGDTLAGGERGPLTVSGNIGHPPAHSACDCILVSG